MTGQLESVDIGRICVDCAAIVANGEDSCEGPCEHGKGLAVGTVLTGDTEDNESEFYVPWKPCPGCGTTLAGSWFEAADLEAFRLGWEVQGHYGQGWECVTTEASRADADATLQTYRENERGIPFRVRRERPDSV
jgi:hypothetical protein